MDTLEAMKDNMDKMKLDEEKKKLKFPYTLRITGSKDEFGAEWASWGYFVKGGSPYGGSFYFWNKKVSLFIKKTEMDNYKRNLYRIIPVSPFKKRLSYCKILPNEKGGAEGHDS